jgi:hypothetical protein
VIGLIIDEGAVVGFDEHPVDSVKVADDREDYIESSIEEDKLRQYFNCKICKNSLCHLYHCCGFHL